MFGFEFGFGACLVQMPMAEFKSLLIRTIFQYKYFPREMGSLKHWYVYHRVRIGPRKSMKIYEIRIANWFFIDDVISSWSCCNYAGSQRWLHMLRGIWWNRQACHANGNTTSHLDITFSPLRYFSSSSFLSNLVIRSSDKSNSEMTWMSIRWFIKAVASGEPMSDILRNGCWLCKEWSWNHEHRVVRWRLISYPLNLLEHCIQPRSDESFLVTEIEFLQRTSSILSRDRMDCS